MSERVEGVSARILGLGVCSLLALVACAPTHRTFEGGGGDPTGSGGGTTSSSSTSSSSTSSTGSGGGAPCDNTDPDCECVGGQVVARDTDKDGHGTLRCEASPGDDCDDADPNFVVNECGGCNKSLGGKVGDPCLECGVFTCMGDSAIACISPSPTPRQCLGDSTIQVCDKGSWTTLQNCSGAMPFCVNAKCAECKPGTFKCGHVLTVDVVIACNPDGTWSSSWTSCDTSSWRCSADYGTCVELFHPRDLDFEVPRLLRDPMGDPPPGMRTRDVLDAAIGIAFG
jgi:hypothetical protein